MIGCLENEDTWGLGLMQGWWCVQKDVSKGFEVSSFSISRYTDAGGKETYLDRWRADADRLALEVAHTICSPCWPFQGDGRFEGWSPAMIE